MACANELLDKRLSNRSSRTCRNDLHVTLDGRWCGGSQRGARACALPAPNLLYDDGQRRNSASHAIHCLLGQEGTPPRKLYAAARGELQQYETVTLRPGRVTEISPAGSQFSVRCSDGSSLKARNLLATGLTDVVPKLTALGPSMAEAFTIVPIATVFDIATSLSPYMEQATKVPASR